VITEIDDKINLALNSLESGSIVLKREKAFVKKANIANSHWYTSAGSVIYNHEFGTSAVYNLYRNSDLEPLDERAENDKWSGLLRQGHAGGFPTLENSDGELRMWTEDATEKRVKIGSILDQEDYAIATKNLRLVAIYSPKTYNIDIFNVDNSTKISVGLGEASDISFQGADDNEIVVSTPTASLKLLSSDGRKLGEIFGIDGRVRLITRQYCAASIWADRGQVLTVSRKWRAFGFLTFGHGGCQDTPNLGK
jgi:hypothetical protein